MNSESLHRHRAFSCFILLKAFHSNPLLRAVGWRPVWAHVHDEHRSQWCRGSSTGDSGLSADYLLSLHAMLRVVVPGQWMGGASRGIRPSRRKCYQHLKGLPPTLFAEEGSSSHANVLRFVYLAQRKKGRVHSTRRYLPRGSRACVVLRCVSSEQCENRCKQIARRTGGNEVEARGCGGN